MKKLIQITLVAVFVAVNVWGFIPSESLSTKAYALPGCTTTQLDNCMLGTYNCASCLNAYHKCYFQLRKCCETKDEDDCGCTAHHVIG